MSTIRFSSLEETESDRCLRCEMLPKLHWQAGSLVMLAPVAYTHVKLRRLLAELGWAWSDRDGVLAIDVAADALPAVAGVLSERLTSVELAAIRALFLESERPPTLRDHLFADSLAVLTGRARAGDLVELLSGDDLTAMFQPIVESDTLDVYAHEALLRTKAGAKLREPAEIFSIARAADMLSHVDLAARRTVIAEAARCGGSAKIFINFMPTSIYDPNSCLRSTIETLDALGIAHDRIVFEVVESEAVDDVAHLLNILAVYRKAGFKVALDDLGSGYASLSLLGALKPDYVKLDMSLVRGIDSDNFKALFGMKLIEAASDLGMRVIAEGVETQGEFDWLRAHGAHLLQGYFIGRPAEGFAQPTQPAAAAAAAR